MDTNVNKSQNSKKPVNKKEQVLKKRIDDFKKVIAFQKSVIDRLEKKVKQKLKTPLTAETMRTFSWGTNDPKQLHEMLDSLLRTIEIDVNIMTNYRERIDSMQKEINELKGIKEVPKVEEKKKDDFLYPGLN